MSCSVEARRNRREALQKAARTLAAIEDAETARLEAEILLCHELRLTRAQLYTRLDSPLSEEEERAYTRLVERRLRHEPIAYITGSKEFFGLEFYVDRRALIPRPETELLVEKALGWTAGRKEPAGGWRIADIGTGSGALAVSLAVHLPASRILATDASEGALLVARTNCERHGVAERVSLLRTDLLASVSETFHIVVANLPYVAREELLTLSPDIREHEPMAALDGGGDGLDLYRRLFDQVPRLLRRESLVLAEIGASQGQMALELARRSFSEAAIELAKDYAGLDRVLVVRKG